MTQKEHAEMESLRARIAELEVARAAKVSALKITEKGGLSVYGLQRFPVTLYVNGWRALLSESAKILKFIEDNKDKFSTKGSKPAIKADSLSATV